MSLNLLGNLRVRLTAETAEFRASLDTAKQRLQSFNRDMNKMGRRTAQAGRILTTTFTAPVLAAGAGLITLANRAADAADQIDKMSIRTGIARGTLQELQYVTDQLGVNFEGTAGVLEAFTRRIPQIEAGTSDTARAFQSLGISLRGPDGQLRAMSDLFPDLLRGLSRIENETERNAIATQLFGRRAFEIVPLLEAGGDEIERLSQRARDLGLIMSDEQVAALVKYKDQMSEVKQQIAATGRELALGFLPILRDQFIPFLQDKVVPALRGVVEALKGVKPETLAVGAGIAGAVAAFGAMFLIVGQVIVALTSLAGLLSVSLLPILGIGGALALGLGVLVTLWAKNKIGALEFRGAMARAEEGAEALTDKLRALNLEQRQAYFGDLGRGVTLLRNRETGLKGQRDQAEQDYIASLQRGGAGTIEQARIRRLDRELEDVARQIQFFETMIVRASRAFFDLPATTEGVVGTDQNTTATTTEANDALTRVMREMVLYRTMGDIRPRDSGKPGAEKNGNKDKGKSTGSPKDIDRDKGRDGGGDVAADVGLQVRSMVATAINSKGELSGGQIGSMVGALAGTFVPAIGTVIGGALGGFIGDLFGGEEKDSPVPGQLRAIERAQRETVRAIEQQTDDLLSPEHRLFNMPSTFRVPAYQPIGGGGGNNGPTYRTTNQYTITVNADAGVPADFARRVEDAVTRAVLGRRNGRHVANGVGIANSPASSAGYR